MKITMCWLFFVFLSVFQMTVYGAMTFVSPYEGTSVYGKVGSSVTFTWSVSGGVATAEWGLKPDGVTDIKDILVFLSSSATVSPGTPPASYTGRVSGIYNGDTSSGRAIFTLTQITKADESIYGCRIASLDLNPIIKTDFVRLIVEEKPTITHPTETTKGFKKGSPVNISCKAVGKPEPNVKWIQNGQVKSSESETAYLTFDTVQKADAGVYTCRANNSAGITERKVTLVVNYKPEGTTITLSKHTAVEGETVTLTCLVNAAVPPVSEYRFYINGSNTPVYTRQNTNNVTISGVQRSQHYGTYRCEAQNGVGHGQSVGVVLDINVPVTIKPLARNTTVNETDSINLRCDASGHPAPTVKWKKDDQPIPSGSVLHITSSSRSDSGRYVCEASNIVDKAEMETFVTVYYPVTITDILPQTPHESWIPQTVTFNCEAEGVPLPTIIWIKPDGSELKKVTATQNKEKVQMKRVSDFGTYTCEAGNGIGAADTRTVELKQRRAPGLPIILFADADIQATSLTVRWTAPAYGGSPITGYRLVLLQDGKAIRNGNTDAAATSFVFDLLDKSTNYTVKVFARNRVFEGNSIERTIQTKYEGVPSIVEIIDLPAETEEVEVTIKWDEPQNNGAPITQYNVYRRTVTDDGTPPRNWNLINETTNLSQQRVVVRLEKGKEYEFVVTAKNKFGESLRVEKNTKKILVMGEAPAAVVITAERNNDEIILKWEKPEENGGEIKRYSVYQKVANDEQWKNIKNITDFSKLEYVVKVEKGKKYEFMVTATNRFGESARSNSEKFDEVGDKDPSEGGLDTVIIAAAAAAGALLILGLILFGIWWKRRKNSSDDGSSAADLRAPNPDDFDDGYSAVGAASAARLLQAADVTYAEVDKSGKTNGQQVTDVYAEVDNSKKKPKKKPKKQPGELDYAELDELRPNFRPAPQSSGGAARPLVRPPAYEGTEYADIAQFGVPQPEPTYDNVSKKDVVYSNVESM